MPERVTKSLAGRPPPRISDRLRGRRLPHIGALTPAEIGEILDLAEWFGDNRYDPAHRTLLAGRVQGLLFVYPSTRTRLGFEAAMVQLGGQNIFMPTAGTQLARGESLVDTIRAIDQYVDVLTGRLWKQEEIDLCCATMEQPVINACTPTDHTTQVLGQLLTMRQYTGKLAGLNLVYVGMARGVLHSFLRVCPRLGINLVLAQPPSYVPTIDQAILAEGEALARQAQTRLEIVTDLRRAVAGAEYIEGGNLLRSRLAGEAAPEEEGVDVPRWTVTAEVLRAARPEVLYSHSGPAHREICATGEVLEGPRSLVTVEARNALYAKKALLALLVR
jgi:ornithine carbamoyltransferase